MAAPTYEDRVAQIECVEDIDVQISRAKAYMMKTRAQAKSADTLQEKLDIQQVAKAAESTLRQLRTSYFDLEDSFAQQA